MLGFERIQDGHWPSPTSRALGFIQAIDEIGDQRRHHEDQGDDDHPGLQHGQVLLVHGVEDQVAEPVVVEDDLEGDQASEEVPDLGADHRNRWLQGVAQDVAS